MKPVKKELEAVLRHWELLQWLQLVVHEEASFARTHVGILVWLVPTDRQIVLGRLAARTQFPSLYSAERRHVCLRLASSILRGTKVELNQFRNFETSAHKLLVFSTFFGVFVLF